jgi:hypothetical protein
MSLQARGALLQNAKLVQVVWRGADLREADMRGADLAGADLRGADLGGADLSGASLRGTDLSGAELAGAKLDGVQSAFAVGLPAPSTAKAARPVRYLAAEPATPDAYPPTFEVVVVSNTAADSPTPPRARAPR